MKIKNETLLMRKLNSNNVVEKLENNEQQKDTHFKPMKIKGTQIKEDE